MARQRIYELSGLSAGYRVLVILVLLICAAARLVSVADDAAYRAGLLGEITSVGGSFAPDPSVPSGYNRVTQVDPGGPLDRAGIKTGDAIHTNPTYYAMLRHEAGTRVPFTGLRDGVRIGGEITVEAAHLGPTERQGNFRAALIMLAAFVTTAIGCYILVRGWGNITAMLLGAGMFVMNPVGLNVPLLFDGPRTSLIFLIVYISALQIGYVLPLFGMRLNEESVGPLPSTHWRAVKGLIAFGLVHTVFQTAAGLSVTAIPLWITGNGVGYLTAQIAMLTCLGYIVAAWWRSEGPARNRNAVILFAFATYFVGAIAGFSILGGAVAVSNRAAAGSLAAFNFVTTGLLGPILLAYAVLRHKLFSLGFAVNRTLVFGTISAVLLAGFGLLEWGVEHLVPEEWREGGALFSGGIAVGLFLIFHRIRDVVEHFIEHLFFRKWQHNEAALKRFVASAAHIEQPDTLVRHYAAELERFTGGAAVAIYRRTAKGHFQCSSPVPAGASARVDADDLALKAMCAEHRGVAPAEVNSALDGALALPMMDHTTLAGFVLLGAKPGGDDHRPDEADVLTWATRRIGVDLQSIHIRELEQRNVKLTERNAVLTEIVNRAALAQT